MLVRQHRTWQDKDYNFSEITYEMERQEKQDRVLHKSKSVEEIIDDFAPSDDEAEDDDDDDSSSGQSRNSSRQVSR